MPTTTLKLMTKRLFFSLTAILLPLLHFAQSTETFTYTGSSQSWVVPPCVYNISVEVAGAEGGGASGGNGAVVTANIAVTPGQTLEINVGGSGNCPGAGWNGGGAGDPGTFVSCGGGGASDIRFSPYNLTDRVIVAGGGGGQAGGTPTNAGGGAGGCATGVSGTGSYGGAGTGGTQTAGGTGGFPYAAPGTNGQNGSLGQGGAGGIDNCTSSASGGGGGGGYYGGGGGGPDCISLTSYIGGGGGGGGSSLTPAGGNCTQGANNGPGYITITYTAGTPATASNTGPYCEGDDIQLSATGSGTFSWTGPNGFTSTQQNPTIPNSDPSMSGTYTVTVTDASCTATATTDVIVDPAPVVDPVSDQTVCAGAATSAVNFTGSFASTSYDWSNDNTSIGLAANGSGDIASFTTTNPGPAQITVTPTANGCVGAPITFAIQVNPVPTIDPITDQTLCAGDNTADIIFTASPAGGTFSWTNSDPSIGVSASGTGDILSFTSSNAGSSPVSSVFTVFCGLGGCTSSAESFTITVNPTPVVDPVADQNICAGDNTTDINFTGNVSGSTYDWTNSNSNIGLGVAGNGDIASFTGTTPNGVSETATITVTPSANGCVGPSEDFVISVNPLPTVDPVTDITVCEGEAVNGINFTGNVASATYDWTNSNANIGLGVSGTGNIASFNGANSGIPVESGTITVTPSVGTCVGNPTSFTIAVNQAPSGTLTGIVDVCEGDPSPDLTFTGSNGTSPYTFTYNLNGGANQTITTVGNTATVSVPTSPSAVIICVAGDVTDANGCSTTLSDQVTVTINPNPTPTITGTLQYCSGSNTNLSTLQPYATYSWSTSESTASIDVTVAQNPITVMVTDNNGCSGTSAAVNVTETSGTTYTSSISICQGDSAMIHGSYESAAGIYTQTLTGSNGCDSISEITLNINPLPIVYAGADKQVCEGVQVTLSGSGAQTYSWDNGVIDNNAFTQNVGTVTYTVTGTDASGCSNTDQVDVTVYALPNVDAGPDQTECEGVQITLSGSGAQSYSWDNGITDSQAFNQPPGVVTYTVTGTDANGCVNADQVNVTIEATPVVDAGPDQSVCEGEMVIVSGSGANNYVWSGGVQNGIPFVPSIGLGELTIVCTGVSINGCIGTDEVSIYVNPIPTASFVADVTTGCEPLEVTFTNTSTGGGSGNCSWVIENNDAMTGCNTVTSTIQQAGCFDVSLTVTSNNGCSNTYTAADYICVDEMPIASFTYNPNDPNTLDPSVSFENNSSYATDYTWDFGDNTPTSTDFEPDHVYPNEEAASYTVMLVASTPAGCIDTAYQYIAIQEVLIFYIPNTFTPDGDQFNQGFKPIFTSGFDPYDFNLTIFNRWGEIVFETNDPDEGWDGSYGSNGEVALCQDGTYVWRIEMKLRNNDDRFIQEGHVNIIR